MPYLRMMTLTRTTITNTMKAINSSSGPPGRSTCGEPIRYRGNRGRSTRDAGPHSGSSRCPAVAQISGRRAVAAPGRRAGDNRESSIGRRSARFPPPPSLKPRQSANCFEAIVCSAPMALYRVESSTANHRT